MLLHTTRARSERLHTISHALVLYCICREPGDRTPVLLYCVKGGAVMAKAARRICAKPGCCALVSGRYCETHTPPAQDKRRPAAYRKWYTLPRFRKARDAFMNAHPLCARCGAVSTDLDHIKPHKGDPVLFWDSSNWQALCASCHSIKTATEDGGFGNRSKR